MSVCVRLSHLRYPEWEVILPHQCAILLADIGRFPYNRCVGPRKLPCGRPFLSVVIESIVKVRSSYHMSKRKRSSGPDGPETRKEKVTYTNFLKWRKDFDRNYHSVSWLECETETVGGKRTVSCLKCTVCRKFKDAIRHRRNFNEHWVTGANTMKTSNIRDHAQSEQHVYAMALLAKERAIS